MVRKTFHWKKGKGRGVEKAATMDYQGQKLAELLYYWIIITFGVSCHQLVTFISYVLISN
jgi:hypothetical protein